MYSLVQESIQALEIAGSENPVAHDHQATKNDGVFNAEHGADEGLYIHLGIFRDGWIVNVDREMCIRLYH